MLKRFLYYGMFGLFLEILWTGLNSMLSGDFTMTGHSSVIMFFIYGMIVFLEPVFNIYSCQHFLVRVMTYSVFIFMVEYFSGIILTRIGVCPWLYLSRYSINGVIRLDYIVLWIIAGYVYERLYFYFIAHNL